MVNLVNLMVFWSSSLTDSTLKGKPDIENARIKSKDK